MQLKKIIVCACASVAMSAALSGVSFARDLLRVGTEPTFAPFEFLDTKTKEFSGYDMDLIRAIGEKAGYDVEIVNMGFDALIPALGAGTIDVIASGLSITEERAKRIDFSAPYYTAGLSMLVRSKDAGKLPDFKSLEGEAIGVQIGTTGADMAKGIAKTKVTAFNATSEAFLALQSGHVSAVIHDRPVLAYYLKTQPRAAKNVKLQPEVADAQDYGFAVKKGNKALLDKINAAYKALVASGEEKAIYSKWFAE